MGFLTRCLGCGIELNDLKLTVVCAESLPKVTSVFRTGSGSRNVRNSYREGCLSRFCQDLLVVCQYSNEWL